MPRPRGRAGASRDIPVGLRPTLTIYTCWLTGTLHGDRLLWATGKRQAGALIAIRALPDLCLGIVSGRLGHLDSLDVSSWTSPWKAPVPVPGAFFVSLCIVGHRTTRQVRR